MDNLSTLPEKTIQKIKNLLPINLKTKLPLEIKVVLINPESSKKFNLVYLGQNKPTNVLSFKYSPEYGEILICPEIVKKEAKRQGNTQAFQMTWMIAHGMIHLAGVHHEESKSVAEKSKRVERKILVHLNPKSEVRNPKQTLNPKP